MTTTSGTELAAQASITPPAITASIEDYGPDGGGNADRWLISSTGPVTIGGIAPGRSGADHGRTLRAVNIGLHPVTFGSGSTGSLPVNRLALGSNITLAPGATLSLYYRPTIDAAVGGWVAAEPGTSGGFGGGYRLQTKGADYTTVDADFGTYIRFTAGTPTLHAPAAGVIGQSITIRNATASPITAGAGTATVAGSRVIAANSVLVLICTAAGNFDAVGGTA